MVPGHDRRMATAGLPAKKPRKPRSAHPDLRDFGKRLALALGDEEQKWLAEKSGVDAGGISRYLRGRGLVGLTATNVLRMAYVLGVRPEWLLTGKGDMRGKWVDVEPEPGESVAQKDKRPLDRRQ